MQRGLLFVVSAPSGTGKTTLVERLVGRLDNLVMSRSYTSRILRTGERQGIDYNFISRSEFERMARDGEFLEWADVFGNLYGTRTADTERHLSDGRDVVLVIDVQGARQVRQGGVPCVAIFVLPPSYEVLEQRLRGRSKDTDEQIRHRLEVARQEVTAFPEYDYLVVNNEVEPSVARLKGIVLAERARLATARPTAEAIVESFRQLDVHRTGATTKKGTG